MQEFRRILRGENIAFEKTLNDLGIKTRNIFTKKWLSTSKVLKNISKKWDKLSRETKLKICDLLLKYSQ